MLLTGSRSRWSITLLFSYPVRRHLHAARSVSRSTDRYGGEHTILSSVTGKILKLPALPILSLDIALKNQTAISKTQIQLNLALSQTPLGFLLRPDLLLKQLDNVAEESPGNLSATAFAKTLAYQFFTISPGLYSCDLFFHYPLDSLLQRADGDFIAKFRFQKTLDGLFLAKRYTSTNFHFTTAEYSDVDLTLRNPPAVLQYLTDGTPNLDLSRIVDPFTEVKDPFNPYPYDVAVAQEVAHHLPLQVGKPALTVEKVLLNVAKDSAAKFAPENYWNKVTVRLPAIDSLRGSFFGLDQNMSPINIETANTITMDHSNVHRAIIALGSNIGDRIEHIEDAIAELESRGLAVQRVSPLYETKAMYVIDQNDFLNGVCEVQTVLRPMELLDVLQDIEKSLGRVKLIEKGPRNIDLDIVLYDNKRISNHRLIVPHKLMLEREFVLKPLAKLIPNETLPAPDNSLSFRTHLLKLQERGSAEPRPKPVTYVHPHFPLLKPFAPDRPTHVMAILNMTPDSFSDAGTYFQEDVEALASTIRNFIAAGATIIDVGGQSTRPNATLLSPRDEINRVVPVVKLIRSLPEAKDIAISVDTFYARVAKAAIDAGADIINDISGGDLDAELFPTVAALRKTIVISHTRGNPQTMSSLTHYEHGVVAGVAEELHQKVQKALEAGVRPWRIILDPGIGFAKSHDQNLELLRNFSRLRNHEGLNEYPWLVGTSRKKFIGTVTDVTDAGERIWGTAATVTSSIREGTDIVRVHDVEAMVQVAKMSDAIYRVKQRPRTTPIFQSPQAKRPAEIDENNHQHSEVEHARNKSSKSNSRFSGRHPLYHALLGSDAGVTDGLNTVGRKRSK